MKVAVIGSRGLYIRELDKYLPPDTTEIVSGGAKGVDTSAKEYAETHNIKITEFIPDYQKFKQGAPFKRNIEIVKYSDFVLAFWDGKSKGTKYVIEQCQIRGVPINVYIIE